MSISDRVFSRDFHAAEGAEAWRVLPEGAYAFFRTDSFAASARLVDAIGGLVGEGVAPAVDIRRDGVTVLIGAFRGEEFGLVQRDLDLARSIAAAADDLGLTADASVIQSLSIIPGAPERGVIMPFWQAVLGYQPRADSPAEDLVDRHERGAPRGRHRDDVGTGGDLSRQSGQLASMCAPLSGYISCDISAERASISAERNRAATSAGQRRVCMSLRSWSVARGAQRTQRPEIGLLLVQSSVTGSGSGVGNRAVIRACSRWTALAP